MSFSKPRPPPSYASSYGGSGASSYGGSYAPSHRTYHIPNYSTSNERTSLVPTAVQLYPRHGNSSGYTLNERASSKSTSSRWITVVVIIFSTAAFMVGLFITLPVNDPAVWRRDRMSYLKDRGIWQEEKRAHIGEERVWKQDMDRWGRERNWREQQYKSAPPGAYWQEPIPEPHCHAYGKRKYTARIIAVPNGWNWVDACKALPIHIHEQTVLTPDMCVDTGRGGTYGHYVIDFNETACEEAMFTDFRDMGCVATGSHMKRTEAQIRNINPNDDWKAMCGTTPATVHGVQYSGPSHCEERQHGERTAIWDIEDFDC